LRKFSEDTVYTPSFGKQIRFNVKVPPVGVTFSQQDLTPFEVEHFVQDLQESDDTPSVDGNQKSAVKTS